MKQIKNLRYLILSIFLIYDKPKIFDYILNNIKLSLEDKKKSLNILSTYIYHSSYHEDIKTILSKLI